MQGLNLYSSIEQYLDFQDEIQSLHNTFKEIVDELNPSSLIDVGCGQGGFLGLFEDTYLKTFGIDLSTKAIDNCILNNLNAKCINLCDVKEKFDCATAIFDVINYIPKDDLRDFFKCSANVLNKDGYFIFDVNTIYGFEDVAQGSLNIDLDDKFIALDAYFDNDILTTNITLFTKKDGLFIKEDGSIKQYYHSKENLKKELTKCGFDVESVLEFKLHDVEQFDKQIFICKKI